ncbi:bleached galactose oxidase [Apodospora peruviana]|uniref:Bleached galactose oxidase n=1 Tax=Apodospora peruviana TaxID=516989 RepID=A0AAE0HUE5_9PEZI|nr:bleached galactose oxidase [Apodospora peruviana]
MFNLRRFFFEAVARSESDAPSDSEILLPVSKDAEKTTWLQPPAPRAQTTRGKARQLPFVIKALFLTSFFAFAIFFGQPIANFAALAYNTVLHCGARPHHHDAPLDGQQAIVDDTPVIVAAKPWGATPINDRSCWKVIECSSTEDASKFGCDKAIDKNGDTTEWKSETKPGAAQWITIDLGGEVTMHSLEVKPSKNLKWKGVVRKHRVDVRGATGDWQPVARGAWKDNRGGTRAIFEPRQAQFVRLWIADTHGDTGFVAISDITVWTVPALPVAVPNGGRWTDTLNFPLVPVTAWLNPKTGRLVTLASFRDNQYDQRHTPKMTLLAEWDPAGGDITQQIIDKTDHDVFCPGTSMDEKGQVFFTGGSSPDIFSIYNPDNDPDKVWVKPTNNKIAKQRGYQGQTYLPDGRTFMIGGTWSGGGGDEDKDGEIYDPKFRNWTMVDPKIPGDAIRMSKSQCLPESKTAGCVKAEWRQHHPWLFAWKDGTVFHAGPSLKMNWFFLAKGSEKAVSAGLRQDAPDKSSSGDTVCGAAVMYDAVNGSILTAGGAPNYHYWLNPKDMAKSEHRFPATNNVFGMSIGNVTPGEEVKAKKLAPLKYARTFANAAILPNGEVFVVGGQKQGEPFYDETWVATPEIYTPSRDTWRDASPNSIPRGYHSWAMLLRDATVLVGGGGLTTDPPDREDTNHYDAQIYQPPYLLTSDGKNLVKRPKITGDNVTSEHKLGTKIEIQTDVPVDLTASLIRYSAVTHQLNNDLRRIPLTLVPQGDRKYTAEIPSDPWVALPGYWMLFVLQNGVPSNAKTVRLFK